MDFLKYLGGGRRSLGILLFILLSYAIGALTKIGIAYNVADFIVFGTFFFISLTLLRKKLEPNWTPREVNLFIYGFGAVLLLLLLLILFEVGG